MRASIFIASAIAALACASCARERSCTAEVTRGAGTHRATATGTKPDDELARDAIRAACERLCAAESPGESGCAGRCVVDVQAAKIGGRSVCGKVDRKP